MTFRWKDKVKLFSGEGIYFLTFVVVNRKRMFGRLKRLTHPTPEGHTAVMEASDLGNAIYREFNSIQAIHPSIQILAKQIMPDHFHAVVWCHEGFEGSIKVVARSFSQACSRIAREYARRQREGNVRLNRTLKNGTLDAEASTPEGTSSQPTQPAANQPTQPTPSQPDAPLSVGPSSRGLPSLSALSNRAAPTSPQTPSIAKMPTLPMEELDCGNGARVLFEKPFIRTLSHKGQLKNIINYTHNNPDNAIMREENPDLYVIRRGIVINGLTFDTMGKNRLLDFPIKQTVAISRNATEEKIQQMAEQALREAERGAVTYTVAISEGEKHVAREIRGHGMPLIVIMPEGFPPEGTAAARYFHPHGVYHKACGEGRLLILSPSEHNYSLESVVKRTEAQLKSRCMARGITYTPIPHNSKRWRFIACNVMLHMITQ
ncbi:MAG: hypothetical protein SPJ79_03060 [Prevotella sp.]|nr:hypothetical protein [Bacteroidales bacterium]MDY5876553.1 hypothetical protein [Prevotella sp.]